MNKGCILVKNVLSIKLRWYFCLKLEFKMKNVKDFLQSLKWIETHVYTFIRVFSIWAVKTDGKKPKNMGKETRPNKVGKKILENIHLTGTTAVRSPAVHIVYN